MKKRILAVMMAAVMVFSMAGCGSKADEKTDDTAKTEATDNKGSDEEEDPGIYCSQLEECNG